MKFYKENAASLSQSNEEQCFGKTITIVQLCNKKLLLKKLL